MSKHPKNWDNDVKTYDDADYFITHNGGTYEGQVGSHGKYRGPRGSMVLKQNHPHDQIPKGLKHQIKKELIAIGIIVVPAIVIGLPIIMLHLRGAQ